MIAKSSDLYLQGYLASTNNFEPVVAVAKELLAKDAVILDIGASTGGKLAGPIAKAMIDVAFSRDN